MPVNVIGTLKPKNNGKFPVAEAVDIKVTGDLRLDKALEKKADLSSVNFALSGKADNSDINSLQSQINEIITPVTQDAEVQNARVDENGVAYTTLKERIDTDISKQNEKTSIISDLLTNSFEITGESIAHTYSAGKYIAPNGTVTTASTTFGCTNYIDISLYTTLSVECRAGFGNGYYGFYDVNQNFISGEFSPNAPVGLYSGVINVPSSAKYIVLAGTPGNEPKITDYSTITIPYSSDVLPAKVVYTVDLVDGNTSPIFTAIEHDAITTERVISPNGTITTYNNEAYTIMKHEIEEGTTQLGVTASANFGNRYYIITDSNNNIIKQSETSESSSAISKITKKVVPIPANAKYITVANIVSSSTPSAELYTISYGLIANEVTESLHSDIENMISGYKPWSGKKWVCVGDSLTEVNRRTTKHYHDYIKADTGITVVNMGVSGTGYKREEGNNNAFYQRIANVPTDADVVTIFGSGNDLSLIADLGTPSDTGTETICGCINTTIDNLISIIPAVSLGIVAPTPWIYQQPTLDDSNSMARYTEALKEICKIRSIPFLDLYHCSNLRPWTEEGRAACYSKDDGNGVHPDETGHKIIAPRFKAFLENLIL